MRRLRRVFFPHQLLVRSGRKVVPHGFLLRSTPEEVVGGTSRTTHSTRWLEGWSTSYSTASRPSFLVDRDGTDDVPVTHPRHGTRRSLRPRTPRGHPWTSAIEIDNFPTSLLWSRPLTRTKSCNRRYNTEYLYYMIVSITVNSHNWKNRTHK